MPSPAPTRLTLLAALRRFRRNRRGSAAVEFALVAPIFFALLFAIIEVAIMFFAGQVLETVTQNSARVLLTGQAQSGTVTACAVSGVSTPCSQATFKTFVCSQIPALFDCSKLSIDVVSAGSFGALSLTNYGDSCSFSPSGVQYSPGGSGQVVVVRLFYQWPLIVTGLGFNMGCGNKRLLAATAAFKNEPF
ncbi:MULTISPECIES: TadE/TadG family type IV pilus assembly protein [unclassified Bradyrhizobium]|uniref:TadE/TadG family type IV pilus assembly protein n=1 Tax=unclassified Bradyrhizobium TaxID=2631580 RepID=UPI0024B1CEE6|nr:TadE/TadG family type IV pilus assembly protein [Bradyrhizobium sp. CB2312]WFU71929.1 TadE/TadG family type IV pilus assembly protein [Bradyrhizobium sp. CB2312]